MATAELNSETLQERAQQITSEARALGSTVETTIREIETVLRAHMDEHPLATLAVATGVGYVLGGGLPSRVTSLLVGIGSRVVLEAAARDLTARLAKR